ncbi:hypothetical protein O9H85_19460 [Paenibacillus filicis]|uniref:Uncharacterized protein n=1 Tax=Paenibacillus gyeongsangnamensis TaxID=3388067 RepID=A0ABT4QCF8_9BACL|nr:hypothetical protein [Paenibacillus filicis]MCZ8514560.1 hypothetical protein [Paenibacillus filicis]
MLVPMKRQAFHALDDPSLLSACFEPLLREFKEIRIREGDESRFYRELTGGQQAFSFQAYYNHVSKSADNLYWWSAYFLAHPGRWSALKIRLGVLKDTAAVSLLEEVEQQLIVRGHPRSLEPFDVSAGDLQKDKELAAMFGSLYDRLQEIAPFTIRRIAGYIQNRPAEFVQWADEA